MSAQVSLGQKIVNNCKNDPAVMVVTPLCSIIYLVMAILGIHGVISHVALGATVLGVGGVTIVATVFARLTNAHNSVERMVAKCAAIVKELLTYILFGALATAGVLSAFTAGWVFTGFWIFGATCCTASMGKRLCQSEVSDKEGGS